MAIFSCTTKQTRPVWSIVQNSQNFKLTIEGHNYLVARIKTYKISSSDIDYFIEHR